VREIRTLRARRRGLETESRITLAGHEGGNPGYRQGRSYGPPRQFPTLPPLQVENLALRHQLGIYRRRCRRPRIGPRDRIFCSWLSRIWSSRREAGRDIG